MLIAVCSFQGKFNNLQGGFNFFSINQAAQTNNPGHYLAVSKMVTIIFHSFPGPSNLHKKKCCITPSVYFPQTLLSFCKFQLQYHFWAGCCKFFPGTGSEK